MTTTIHIEGGIGSVEPDPTAPSDPMRAWIGSVAVQWVDEGTSKCKTAAILKVTTGRGSGDPLWGPHVLVLRWIGDPPPPEIARSVYDLIADGGPTPRTLVGAWESQQRTPAQSSYRRAS
jgi:hypothetical protein